MKEALKVISVNTTDLLVEAFRVHVEDEEISQAGGQVSLCSLHQQSAVDT